MRALHAPATRWFLDWPRVRARPEWLFVPFAAVWLAVNVAPWGFGLSYLYSFYLAFTYQKTDVIFPFTYAFAVATTVALMWTGLRWARLDFGRSLLIAGTVPFAGPGLFEIVYQESGRFVRPPQFVGGAIPYVMFSFGTWVVLGLTALGWWRFSWRWVGVVGYSIGGFIVWLALGFPLVSTGTFVELPAAYLLNISLKASFFLIFSVPVMEGMYSVRRRNEESAGVRPGRSRLDVPDRSARSPGGSPPEDGRHPAYKGEGSLRLAWRPQKRVATARAPSTSS